MLTSLVINNKVYVSILTENNVFQLHWYDRINDLLFICKGIQNLLASIFSASYFPTLPAICPYPLLPPITAHLIPSDH